MCSCESKSTPRSSANAHFKTTHWSVVLNAGHSSSSGAQEALGRLCRDYWYPLYAYVRRRGYSPHEAQDLTQDFFALFLENHGVKQADPQRGRFRTFLIASLRNFLANEWDRRKTVKRGGGCWLISWDELAAEDRYRKEPSHDLTPEKLYERRWMITLLEKTMAALRQESVAGGQANLFEALQGYLSGGTDEEPYQAVAARLGLTEGAVKMRVVRMRRRFGELLRAEIAQTVRGRKELEEELRHLFAACG